MWYVAFFYPFVGFNMYIYGRGYNYSKPSRVKK